MNPYAPPEAAVHDLPVKPGSAFKAVALGLATDIGGTLVATVILALIYGAALGAAGVRREEIAAAMQVSATDSWFFYAMTGVGLGFSVLGGYVCARIARRSELKLGAIPTLLPDGWDYGKVFGELPQGATDSRFALASGALALLLASMLLLMRRRFFHEA